MNLEQRLSLVFSQSFQINRVTREIEQLRDAKGKLGFDIRYISRQGWQFAIIFQFGKQRLSPFPQLSFIDKLKFKVVLHNTYPTEAPSIYFLSQDCLELSVNPFYNYIRHICPQWGPKINILDIIQRVPAFLAHNISAPLIGEGKTGQLFEEDRLFNFIGCQTFPVKLMRSNAGKAGIMGIMGGSEIVLLEQSKFMNSYINTDFIKIEDVYSVRRNKNQPLRILLEVKRKDGKYALQFVSDECETILSLFAQIVKPLPFKSTDSDSDSSEDNEKIPAQKAEDLHITDKNISLVESQITILLSLADSTPTASKVKELVDLLKKAVEYYSFNLEDRCNVHLRSLQSIMNNQLMQALLASEQAIGRHHSKQDYQSITNFI